jgi:hypothetical protein
VPAKPIMRSLAQNAFILVQFSENRLRLGSQGNGRMAEKIHQGADSSQSVRRIVPLRLRQGLRPIGGYIALIQKQRQRIFIRGEEFKQRGHMQALCQALEGIFVAGQGMAVHKDVETGIFALDNDIQACSHHSESSGDIGRKNKNIRRGHAINHRCAMMAETTQVYQVVAKVLQKS